MKRLLLVVVLLAAAAVQVGPAGAAVPCRQKIYTDWRQDGKIATTYPIGCYRDALKHLGSDATIYSNLGPDIRAAMQAAILRKEGKHVKAVVGKGFAPLKPAGKPVLVSQPPHSTKSPSRSPQSTDHSSSGPTETTAAAPVASTSDGGGLPLPILLLGGLALALAAAGAIGAAVRHARTRRTP
jgi:hypothetical protein